MCCRQAFVVGILGNEEFRSDMPCCFASTWANAASYFIGLVGFPLGQCFAHWDTLHGGDAVGFRRVWKKQRRWRLQNMMYAVVVWSWPSFFRYCEVWLKAEQSCERSCWCVMRHVSSSYRVQVSKFCLTKSCSQYWRQIRYGEFAPSKALDVLAFMTKFSAFRLQKKTFDQVFFTSVWPSYRFAYVCAR